MSVSGLREAEKEGLAPGKQKEHCQRNSDTKQRHDQTSHFYPRELTNKFTEKNIYNFDVHFGSSKNVFFIIYVGMIVSVFEDGNRTFRLVV